jgi:hypothetical protein
MDQRASFWKQKGFVCRTGVGRPCNAIVHFCSRTHVFQVKSIESSLNWDPTHEMLRQVNAYLYEYQPGRQL